mmetsp:Transcript_29475/g.44717  ORF Transcript_29475/g.44717 Transcript_29475/m.44717 type:complete len:160 (+) Transcript_29475:1659-2138(+)
MVSFWGVIHKVTGRTSRVIDPDPLSGCFRVQGAYLFSENRSLRLRNFERLVLLLRSFIVSKESLAIEDVFDNIFKVVGLGFSLQGFIILPKVLLIEIGHSEILRLRFNRSFEVFHHLVKAFVGCHGSGRCLDHAIDCRLLNSRPGIGVAENIIEEVGLG